VTTEETKIRKHRKRPMCCGFILVGGTSCTRKILQTQTKDAALFTNGKKKFTGLTREKKDVG